jgi:hypothetical protein
VDGYRQCRAVEYPAVEDVPLVQGPEALLGAVLERDHVIYESRLELSRLIFADFDRAVHRILAQPFLLKVRVARKIRKHVPDYFLVTDHGPVVVDVKPEHLLTRPTMAATFAWTRQLVEDLSVASGETPASHAPRFANATGPHGASQSRRRMSVARVRTSSQDHRSKARPSGPKRVDRA